MPSLKEELLYKKINDPFFLPVRLQPGKQISEADVIIAIVSEDQRRVLSKEMFELAKQQIQNLIQKVESVKNSFQAVVESAESRENGKTVGCALEHQLWKLIPKDLVGGKSNKLILLKNFKRAFLFGKQDELPVSFLTDNIAVKNIVWMTKYSISLKEDMLAALVKWLWRVAKRLVAANFYVSDSQAAPNQLVYIPKKCWKSETDRAFNVLPQLQPLSEAEGKRLGKVRTTAALRWMPKSQGLRPILSVRGDRKSQGTVRAKNLLLSLVRRNRTLGLNNIKKVHEAWQHLVKQHKNGRKLYFVACDVYDAYGSVNQDKLISIIEEEVIRQFGSIWIERYSEEICTIKNAVKFQTMKTTKKYYLLTKGLGQGMPMSGPLCTMYLSHMDKTWLASFTSDPDDKLIRSVDDYMYITHDKAKAQRFLDTMNQGNREYGIQIKHSKTQTNLEGDLEILYYGYLINTANLEVYCRYKEGISVTSRNSMMFKSAPVQLLEKKLCNMSYVKLNRFTLDRQYMTVEGVARNVLHTAFVLACRLTSILSLTPYSDIPEGVRLADLVIRSAEVTAGRVCRVWASLNRDRKANESASGSCFMSLTKEEIHWIALRAFSMTLVQASSFDSMINQIPPDLPGMVSELEERAKSKVQPTVLSMLAQITSNIPHQFRNLADD